MFFLALLCIFTTVYGEFTFPSSHNDILFADTEYNISWNADGDGYEHIFLLHKNRGIAEDRLSIFKNGTNILNEDVKNKRYFMWKTPYDLNRYNLDNHYFRFAVGKKNIFQNVLGYVNDVSSIYSTYFKIETNMNISLNYYIVHPDTEYNINKNGFTSQQFCIEENKDNIWILAYCINDNIFVPRSVFTLNKFRISLTENNIARHSNEFNIYNKQLVLNETYLINKHDTIDIKWVEYNDKREQTVYIIDKTDNVVKSKPLWNVSMPGKYTVQISSGNFTVSKEVDVEFITTTTTGTVTTGTTGTVTTGTVTTGTVTTGTVTTGTVTTGTVTTGTVTTGTVTTGTTGTVTTGTVTTGTVTNATYDNVNNTVIFIDTVGEKEIKQKHNNYIYLIVILLGSILFILILSFIIAKSLNNDTNKVGSETDGCETEEDSSTYNRPTYINELFATIRHQNVDNPLYEPYTGHELGYNPSKRIALNGTYGNLSST